MHKLELISHFFHNMRIRLVRREWSQCLMAIAIDAPSLRRFPVVASISKAGNAPEFDLEGDSLLQLLWTIHVEQGVYRTGAYARISIPFFVKTNCEMTRFLGKFCLVHLLCTNSDGPIVIDTPPHPILVEFFVEFFNRDSSAIFPSVLCHDVRLAASGWESMLSRVRPGFCLVLKIDADAFRHPIACTVAVAKVELDNRSGAALTSAQIANVEAFVARASIQELHASYDYTVCVFVNASIRVLYVESLASFAHRLPRLCRLYCSEVDDSEPPATIDASGCPRLQSVVLDVFQRPQYEAVLRQVPQMIFPIQVRFLGDAGDTAQLEHELTNACMPHLYGTHWTPALHGRCSPETRNVAGGFFLGLERLQADGRVSLVDPAAAEYIMRALDAMNHWASF